LSTLGSVMSGDFFVIDFEVTTQPALTPFLNAHRAIPLSRSGRGAKTRFGSPAPQEGEGARG
jgi:hypothetical protein